MDVWTSGGEESIKMSTWYTSDPHLGHENILRFCSKTRPYSSIWEMDCAIIDAWNYTVRDNDTVKFLGDFSMKSHFLIKYLPQLRGNIDFILGNHDVAHPRFKEQKVKKFTALMKELNPKVRFIGIQQNHRIGNHEVLLCHFPWYYDLSVDLRYPEYRPQRKDHPGKFLVHGHMHSDPEFRIGLLQDSLDIGWDAWSRMVSEEEIETIITECKKSWGSLKDLEKLQGNS